MDVQPPPSDAIKAGPPPSDGDLPPELPRSVRPAVLSGKMTVLTLLLCLGAATYTVLFLEANRSMPLWLRLEAVLGGWWIVWVAVLGHLLYYGNRLSDDHRLGSPRNWLKSILDGGRDFTPSPSGGDVTGCLVVLLAMVLLVLGLWLLIEIVIPAIAFVMYLLIREMLTRVAHDRHGCEGRTGRALAWAAVWATAYTLPLVTLVWLCHWIVVKPGG